MDAGFFKRLQTYYVMASLSDRAYTVTIYNFSKGARRSLKEKLWIYVTIFTLADVTCLFNARLVTQIQICRELFQDPFALPPSNHR